MGTLPLDAVISWVDGHDPVFRKKRDGYLTGRHEDRYEDIAGNERYISLGEIYFCIASIIRFAPFIKRIFIVTDGQNPHADRFVRQCFPESDVQIRIIDHKEIFKGYERYLPVFNSLSIETMLYRIPGLSEYFVYFNDDVFLSAPVSITDFVIDGKPVVYGYWHLTFTAWLCRELGRIRKHAPFTFRDSMLNAALILGGKARHRFIRIQHTPHVLRRSVCERFYAAHPELLDRNLRHRFRDKEQFNPQTMFHTMMLFRGESILKSAKRIHLYIDTRPGRIDDTCRILPDLLDAGDVKFCCLNSYDWASDEQKKVIARILADRLAIPDGAAFNFKP